MHDAAAAPAEPTIRRADVEGLAVLDAYWRAANYLSVGQIYLLDNALLREPLRPEHIKPRLLGHWGTSPGLNFVYAHLNRVIAARDASVLYVCGPGHGGPAMVANAWLEGTYSELFSHVGLDGRGITRLFHQFSFPGGIPSHAAPETPGSINEGGELGYALAHAYGAAFDNPELVVACVVGDGEAETGALATSWHANKFVDPRRDGCGPPDPASERVQDRQSHRAGPHPRPGAAGAVHRLWLSPGRRGRRLRRRGPHGGARAYGRRPGRRVRRHRAHLVPGQGPRGDRASCLADARAAHAQGLDGSAGGRRGPDRGHLPRPPGPAVGGPVESRPPRPARAVDAQLPPRGVVRRHGAVAPRAGGVRTPGRASHERHPPCQRGCAAARPRAPRLDRLRRRRRRRRAPRCTRRRTRSASTCAT